MMLVGSQVSGAGTGRLESCWGASLQIMSAVGPLIFCFNLLPGELHESKLVQPPPVKQRGRERERYTRQPCSFQLTRGDSQTLADAYLFSLERTVFVPSSGGRGGWAILGYLFFLWTSINFRIIPAPFIKEGTKIFKQDGLYFLSIIHSFIHSLI